MSLGKSSEKGSGSWQFGLVLIGHILALASNLVFSIHGSQRLPELALGLCVFTLSLNLLAVIKWRTFGFRFWLANVIALLAALSLHDLTLRLDRPPWPVWPETMGTNGTDPSLSRTHGENLAANMGRCADDQQCGETESGACLATALALTFKTKIIQSTKCVCLRGPVVFGCVPKDAAGDF